MIGVTKEQACRFLLAKNGLLGSMRFRGKEGVLDYVYQAGCVQYDPVDVCGKSHELAFLARVKGFSKELLESHIRTCVVTDIKNGDDEVVTDLVKTIHKLMK